MHQLFTHPGLLLALFALPALSLLAVMAARRRQRALIALSGLVSGLLLARRRPGRLYGPCLWLGLAAAAVGMAGPRWGRDWSQSAAPGRDLVVVVDLSRSMFAEAPNRVELARDALRHLAEALRARGGHRVALVTFAGRAELICPLTHDVDHFLERVESLDTRVPDATLGGGTRLGEALQLAVQAHDGRARGARDILLLSDGDDPARDGEWRAGTELARAEGVPVHVVGLGDAGEGHRIPADGGWLMHNGQEVRTRLEEAPLRDIARRTGGVLLLAGTRQMPLGDHYRALAELRGDDESPDALPVYRQRHVWFLLPAFALLLLTLLLPEKGRST